VRPRRRRLLERLTFPHATTATCRPLLIKGDAQIFVAALYTYSMTDDLLCRLLSRHVTEIGTYQFSASCTGFNVATLVRPTGAIRHAPSYFASDCCLVTDALSRDSRASCRSNAHQLRLQSLQCDWTSLSPDLIQPDLSFFRCFRQWPTMILLGLCCGGITTQGETCPH